MLGIGTSLGSGYYVVQTEPADYQSPSLVVGDLNLFIAVSSKIELQIWLPILNMALSPSVLGSTVFLADVAAKVYPSGTGAGFFVAPGLGIAYVGGDYGGQPAYLVGPVIPLRIGYEFAGASRIFGFSVSAHPWIQILSASDGSAAFGYGALVELGFNLYWTR